MGTIHAFTKIALPLILLGFFHNEAQAKPVAEEPSSVTSTPTKNRTTRLMIEIDPMPFALSGHAVHIRVPLSRVPGLVISAGTYGMSFPDLFTNINAENQDKGWETQIDKAYAIFSDYHISGKVEGLFVGAQVAYQGFEVERTQSDERISFGVVIAMARIGTLWKPFDSGFYLLPWAGVYANIRTDDNALRIGDEEFDVASVAGFATLHLGWQL